MRPYGKAQKNDERDAKAIAEAATRPTMHFVELKSEAQLAMQSLHRARDRLVGERTALINQLRAILLERGITALQGRRKLEIYLETLGISKRGNVYLRKMLIHGARAALPTLSKGETRSVVGCEVWLPGRT